MLAHSDPILRAENPEWLAMAKLLQPSLALSGVLLENHQRSALGALLLPLLVALGYHGDWRAVADALPFTAHPLDLTALRDTLARLSFNSHVQRCALNDIHPRRVPCLFISNSGQAYLLLRDSGQTLVVYDPQSARIGLPDGDDLDGIACYFSPLDLEERQAQQARSGWFAMVTQRFRPALGPLLLLSLLLTLLQAVFPLFVMTVYDRVLGSRSLETLYHLLVGSALALLFDWLMRRSRAQMMVYIGARLDGMIGCSTFLRILSLPTFLIERAPVGVQVARLQEFDALRAFLTTPMALLFFDLPFSLLLLLVIGMLAGMLAFIPLLAILLFALLWWSMQPSVAQAQTRSRLANGRKQEFVMESCSKMATIRQCGSETIRMESFRALAAQAAEANRQSEQINTLAQTLSHILVVSTGVTTISAAVLQVMAGELSGGALVAIMILVWKVLSPMQTALHAITHLRHLHSDIQQINALMNAQPEQEEFAPPEPSHFFRGQISFAGVGVRYSAEAEPALAGLSCEIKAGECVAIIGPNGSGKSTILKLLAGLYAPQAGQIRIDGMDIRRLNPLTLRRGIAYLPQSNRLFYGTLADNLRLGNPLASDEEILQACRQATLLPAIEKLPEGLHTWVSGQMQDASAQYALLSAGFVQKLALARLYLRANTLLRNSSGGGILLLDEPTSSLDQEADQAFMAIVRRLRGHVTLLLVTHRPSHMRLAERIFYLERGVLRLAGPTAEVLAQILKESA
ncbi:peptidase domain-containing ABC transporter [Candidatus Magnetaquicoccus inordinatus]|uniref:peptidase domain-containing ABC transporter n=1 Tax=Candidatus Magnetaquicoccus inordinatus TaxID=2496818 RepID=UPI00102B2AC4|nr:ATP-binding cassette domain-containing protein [Candidatus Magnetaquicoccus inordinatus]